MNPHEKAVVATHEAGHALVASLLPGIDPVHKVSVVPRGRALGYTWQRPTEDRYLMTETELKNRLTVLVGGRVAETLTFHEVSTGAADDFARATDLARRMVTEYGMSPVLGPVRLAAIPSQPTWARRWDWTHEQALKRRLTWMQRRGGSSKKQCAGPVSYWRLTRWRWASWRRSCAIRRQWMAARSRRSWLRNWAYR
jgi:hypothetical protein